MSTQKTSVKKAFTLTELLVSMAILGLIASLTLPHMFMSMDRAKKRAVFKEAYQALQDAVYASTMEGEANASWNIVNRRLNVSKICDTNARTQGCTSHQFGEAGEPGVVLSTGVTVFGLHPVVSSGDAFVIGLEDFPQREYFYFIANYSDKPIDMRQFFDGYGGSTNWIGYPVQYVPDPVVRPGQLKCVEQNCLDMFNN